MCRVQRPVVGKSPLIWKIDEIKGIDIDDPIDFDLAEYAYSKGKQQKNCKIKAVTGTMIDVTALLVVAKKIWYDKSQ